MELLCFVTHELPHVFSNTKHMVCAKFHRSDWGYTQQLERYSHLNLIHNAVIS